MATTAAQIPARQCQSRAPGVAIEWMTRAIAAIGQRCLEPELIPDHEIGADISRRNDGAADIHRENRARPRRRPAARHSACRRIQRSALIMIGGPGRTGDREY